MFLSRESIGLQLEILPYRTYTPRAIPLLRLRCIFHAPTYPRDSVASILASPGSRRRVHNRQILQPCSAVGCDIWERGNRLKGGECWVRIGLRPV
jgi:hypothetical protein